MPARNDESMHNSGRFYGRKNDLAIVPVRVFFVKERSVAPDTFTLPPPFLYYVNHLRTGFMQFLWCGYHLPHEERQHDPFCNPALLPCATIECALFREEPPLCVHLMRERAGEELPTMSRKNYPDTPAFLGEPGNSATTFLAQKYARIGSSRNEII